MYIGGVGGGGREKNGVYTNGSRAERWKKGGVEEEDDDDE